jgi:hypothetical protein
MIELANMMIDEATELQNQGRWDEAEAMLAEAEDMLNRAEAV